MNKKKAEKKPKTFNEEYYEEDEERRNTRNLNRKTRMSDSLSESSSEESSDIKHKKHKKNHKNNKKNKRNKENKNKKYEKNNKNNQEDKKNHKKSDSNSNSKTKSYNYKKFKPDLKEKQYFQDSVQDIYSSFYLDNTFCVFKSINNILNLVYSNIEGSIIFYNIISNQRINEIKRAHNDIISNIRYYYDKNKKRDLILSISANDNNLKLWNVRNMECLSNIRSINKGGYLYSACLLNICSKQYIISTNCSYYSVSEGLKVLDLYGNKIKEFDDSYDYVFFVDTYHDKKTQNHYIICGNNKHVKSYDFNENEIYNKYADICRFDHSSILVNEKEDITELIESSTDGKVRIWDFHSGQFIKKIKASNTCLYGICLWSDDYLFAGCKDENIKLIDLKEGKLLKDRDLVGHDSSVLTIKKITHPKLGECLISQGIYEKEIRFWKNKK